MNRAGLVSILGRGLPIVALTALGCGEDGTGTARFTTWGEAYIEEEIPADAAGEHGFADGWTLHYNKFLVAFHNIMVKNSAGETGGAMTGSILVDNAQKGRKDLIAFPELKAQHWDKVSYQIRPASASSALVGATEADRTLAVAGGYAIYVEGEATKANPAGTTQLKKTFRWGFKTATQYDDCTPAEEGGQPKPGVVVTSGGTDVSELTTHGDHFFYDRLQASADPAVATRLRFDQKAAADKNNDGEVTLEELSATMIDVTTYDPSPFDAANLGAFVTALSRTVGHFRGEGECSVSEIGDQVTDSLATGSR